MGILLSRNIIIPVLIGLIFSIVSLFISQTFLLQEYSAEARIDVISTQQPVTNSSVYNETAIEISHDLAKAIETEIFLTYLYKSQQLDLTELMALESGEQYKEWKKVVSTKVESDSTVIAVKVYDASVDKAQKIALAIFQVLQDKGNDFLAPDQSVKFQMNDAVLVSSKPVRPNMVLIAFIAGVAGLIIGIGIRLLNTNIQSEEPSAEWLEQLIQNEINKYGHDYSVKHYEVISDEHQDYQVLHIKNYHIHLGARHAHHRAVLGDGLDEDRVRHLHDHKFKK